MEQRNEIDVLDEDVKKILDIVENDPLLMERLEENFYEEIENHGEVIIGKYSFKEILEIVKKQGYWSGVVYNIWLTRYGFEAEIRVFGNI